MRFAYEYVTKSRGKLRWQTRTVAFATAVDCRSSTVDGISSRLSTVSASSLLTRLVALSLAQLPGHRRRLRVALANIAAAREHSREHSRVVLHFGSCALVTNKKGEKRETRTSTTFTNGLL